MKRLAVVLMLMAGVAEGQTRTEKLYWTAPGDDGSTGRAAAYDMGYKSVPPAGADTTSLRIWWNSAGKVTGMPIPSASGARDSVSVPGLVPTTTYWFMVRTRDEAMNWSGYGNVFESRAVDIVAPRSVTDLGNTR